VLGGLLLDHFWWGSVFLINIPVVLVGLVVGWWVIPESRNPVKTRLDVPGVLLSILATGGLVWTMIEAPARGWGVTGDDRVVRRVARCARLVRLSRAAL
jgi:hypothetical protein